MRIEPQRVASRRGIVCIHNRQGRLLDVADINRWIRLNRLAFSVDKLDIVAYGTLPSFVRGLASYTRIPHPPQWDKEHYDAWQQTLDLDLSLRVDCAIPPPRDITLEHYRLWDVYLCPASIHAPHFEDWLDACTAARLPIRVQLRLPFCSNFNVAACVERFAAAGVAVVNIALDDPFAPPVSPARRTCSPDTIPITTALVAALTEKGIEANVIGLPFCAAPDALRPHIENQEQFFLDHQQYDRKAYELCLKLFPRHPKIAGKSVVLLLARNASFHNPLDEWMLEWLFTQHPTWYTWVILYRKWARDFRYTGRLPELRRPDLDPAACEVQQKARREPHRDNPACRQCRLRWICDGFSSLARQMFPDFTPQADLGNSVVYPLHYAKTQPKYYDSMDDLRVQRLEAFQETARCANAFITSRPPTHTHSVFMYSPQDVFFEPLSGAVRWHAMTRQEQATAAFACTNHNIAVSVTFGGGIAQYIGFAFGKYIRILCPMLDYSHRLTFYLHNDGRYVLLRDGEPVEPIELDGPYYVPARMAIGLGIHLSIWNMDETIATQDIEIWENVSDQGQAERPPLFSIIIVCSRFSRRLQAVLQTLAHQTGVDHRDIEVIVAYVPGVDSTDDIIDSMAVAYPNLRIIRSPFTPRHLNAKGFMLNESLQLARGEWIVLLDSDILLAPGLLANVRACAGQGMFIAPDGRKMLDRETTARILLGEIEPWHVWENLISGPGEFRYRESEGVPIGFCQIFRRACLEKVRYAEYGNYEGADFEFAKALRETYGKEIRLEGMPVMHLDHGGSQWYGVRKQL